MNLSQLSTGTATWRDAHVRSMFFEDLGFRALEITRLPQSERWDRLILLRIVRLQLGLCKCIT